MRITSERWRGLVVPMPTDAVLDIASQISMVVTGESYGSTHWDKVRMEEGVEKEVVDQVDLLLQGSYVCSRCEQALFSSDDKFMGPCIWPSFRRTKDDAVEERDAAGMQVVLGVRGREGEKGADGEISGTSSRMERKLETRTPMRDGGAVS
eukprot:768749-Hanusia_phi.AAC.34